MVQVEEDERDRPQQNSDRIEEFKALRAEILLTIRAQHKVVLNGTPILTALLVLGFAVLDSDLLLASVGIFGTASVLAVALVSLWMTEETRRIRASFFIWKRLEPILNFKWEKFVHGGWEKSREKGFPKTAFEKHYTLLKSSAILTLIVMFSVAFFLFNVLAVYYIFVTFSPPFAFFILIVVLGALDFLYLYYVVGGSGQFRILLKIIREERILGQGASP